MKTLLIVAILVAAPCINGQAVDAPIKFGKIITRRGDEYNNVTVTQKTSNGITIAHDSGIGSFAWSDISAETQKVLGYDAAAEAAALKKSQDESIAAHTRLKKAEAQFSRKQLKAILSKFNFSLNNAKAWKAAFTDSTTVAISYSYWTPAQWFPLNGIAMTYENQIRDAMAAKFIQQQGGRGFSDEEVRYLPFESRIGLERHPPQSQIFRFTFPSSHSAAISHQIYRYRLLHAQSIKETVDLGTVGENSFGFNADGTFRLNRMSFTFSEVDNLDFLIKQVPAIQNNIYNTLVNK